MRLRRGTVVIASFLLLVIPACGGDGGGDGSIKVELEERNDSGISGEATLTPEGQGTRVVIELNTGQGSAHPAHIHEQACENIDPTPSDPLNDVVDGRSDTIVDVTLDHLRSSPHAINVHHSLAGFEQYLACGSVGD
jgi:hypothetical protein